jgi:hypothetical protein
VDALLLEQVAEARPEEVVVVDEQDSWREAVVGRIRAFAQDACLPLCR